MNYMREHATMTKPAKKKLRNLFIVSFHNVHDIPRAVLAEMFSLSLSQVFAII